MQWLQDPDQGNVDKIGARASNKGTVDILCFLTAPLNLMSAESPSTMV